ncbi:membrane protein [Clostridia bacterium]|nr:membrane protein [Clostridia bacterium]
MAIFQVIKLDNPTGDFLIWRYPKTDITTGSQLIVNPSQEAVFVRGGQICDVLPPGTHTLTTENLPVLAALVNLPFGKRSPFSAEVFFVNKLHILNIRWGTQVPFQITDPVYNILIPVRAFGQYGVTVADPGLFIGKVAGPGKLYTAGDLAEYFRGVLNSQVIDILAGFMAREKVSFTQFSANMAMLSERIRELLAPKLEPYGLNLESFHITSINVPEDDPSVIRLKKALDKKNEMNIMEHSYQEEQRFEVLKKAAGAPTLGLGKDGMNAVMATVLGDMIKGSGVGAAGKPPEAARECPGCGAELPADSLFCPRCGKKQEAEEHRAFCVKCGAALTPDMRFCGKCGAPVT